MRFPKPYYLVVKHARDGRVVLAELFTSRSRQFARRDKLLKTGYGPTSPYIVHTNILSDRLPPLRGHPPENLRNIAKQTPVPFEVLAEVQREEQRLHDSLWERAKVRILSLVWYAIIAVGGFALFEARRLRSYQDALHPVAIVTLAILALFVIETWRDTRSFGSTLAVGLFILVLILFASMGFEMVLHG